MVTYVYKFIILFSYFHRTFNLFPVLQKRNTISPLIPGGFVSVLAQNAIQLLFLIDQSVDYLSKPFRPRFIFRRRLVPRGIHPRFGIAAHTGHNLREILCQVKIQKSFPVIAVHVGFIFLLLTLVTQSGFSHRTPAPVTKAPRRGWRQRR